MGAAGAENPHRPGYDFHLDRCIPQNLAVSVKGTRPVSLNAHSLHAKTPDARGSQLAAMSQGRNERQHFHEAQILQQHEVELPIIRLCIGGKTQTRAVAGRIEHAQKKHIGVDFCWGIGCDNRTNAKGLKTDEGANCGKKITEAAAQVSVNTPRVTCSFGIETYSAPTRVEAFLAVSGAYQGSIKKTGLAIQKKRRSK